MRNRSRATGARCLLEVTDRGRKGPSSLAGGRTGEHDISHPFSCSSSQTHKSSRSQGIYSIMLVVAEADLENLAICSVLNSLFLFFIGMGALRLLVRDQ